jgi:hypothetical protein
MKMKECIICGTPVPVDVESEIVSCNDDNCIRTIENSIGLHYYHGRSDLEILDKGLSCSNCRFYKQRPNFDSVDCICTSANQSYLYTQADSYCEHFERARR